MTPEIFADVMGNTLPREKYESLLPSFVRAMRAAGCTTPQRAAMWCAQLGHESGGLKFVRELWGPTAAQASYEGRADLGNTQAGDGFRFRGRGAIQLTGRHNYDTVSKWAHSTGWVDSPDFFVQRPEMLETEKFLFLPAVWYWTVARPGINAMCDQGDVNAVTRAINGGLTHVEDRRYRYRKALGYGEKLITHEHTSGKEKPLVEKTLKYPRTHVTQDTFYNCGPASTQTIILAATGSVFPENKLGSELGTHRGGTDYIGQFPRVLNRHIPGAQYRHRDVQSYPDASMRETIWREITASIDAGHGVVVNIVAPPSNYPRGVRGSISPAYGGGTVYHYIAVMGYGEDDAGRWVWVADSGFAPYGYNLSFDQLCTLVVPKGYAFSTAEAKQENVEKKEVNLFGEDQVKALHEIKLGTVALNERLDRIERGLIESAINPKAKFTTHGILRVIDATCWSLMRVMKEIAAKHGIDADEVLAKAIENDRNRK